MPQLVIRPYDDTDEDAVLDLLAASLNKTVDDRYRGFFRWKHLENPFGRSFMWVAEVDGRLGGFRSFLRWRFVDPGGDPVEAVRAVDTATHPDFQGVGIFSKLTMHGLDEMRPRGIQFVFNTPNDQSRPGYLKMGWHVEGRVPVKVRPRSLGSLWRMGRAKTAAEVWSMRVDLGQSVDSLEEGAIEPERMPDRLVTDRSIDSVQWRYGGCPAVASRALKAGAGSVLVRFRRRGGAVECTIGDVIGHVDPTEAASVMRSALRSVAADYAIAGHITPVGGMFPMKRLGPLQTRRPLSGTSPDLPLALSLGDVEMF